MANHPPVTIQHLPTESPGELPGLFRRFGFRRAVRFAEPLFERGERGDSMYLLESGQVELIFKGGKAPKRLDPGAVFGELAFLIGDYPRSATAITISPGVVWELDQQGFQRLYREAPDTLCQLMRNTCRYLFVSEQQLIEDLETRQRELELAMDFLRRTQEELGPSLTSGDILDLETGLYNEHYLRQRMVAAASAGALHRHALLRLDLVGIEAVAALLGHEYGEMLINQFADTLRRLAGEQDIPCRLAGPAFALLIAQTNEADAQRLARDIYQQTALRSLDIPNLGAEVSVIIGGAMGTPGEGATELRQRADAALAQAVSQGAPALCWEGRRLAP